MTPRVKWQAKAETLSKEKGMTLTRETLLSVERKVQYSTERKIFLLINKRLTIRGSQTSSRKRS